MRTVVRTAVKIARNRATERTLVFIRGGSPKGRWATPATASPLDSASPCTPDGETMRKPHPPQRTTPGIGWPASTGLPAGGRGESARGGCRIMLTADQKQEYDQAGCLLVSGLIPPETTAAAEAAMWRLIGASPNDPS